MCLVGGRQLAYTAVQDVAVEDILETCMHVDTKGDEATTTLHVCTVPADYSPSNTCT